MTEEAPFISPMHGAMLEDLAATGRVPSLISLDDGRWCCQIILEHTRKRSRYNHFADRPNDAIWLAYDAAERDHK